MAKGSKGKEKMEQRKVRLYWEDQPEELEGSSPMGMLTDEEAPYHQPRKHRREE